MVILISYSSYPFLTRSYPVLISVTPVSKMLICITYTHPNLETDAILRSSVLWLLTVFSMYVA